ncbi:MAG: DNRLRE domain-containing protein, partial [Pseudomonadota bacterium]
MYDTAVYETRPDLTSSANLRHSRIGFRIVARIFFILLLIFSVFSSRNVLAKPQHPGAVPHPKGCAEDEIYISSQDWWLTTPGEVGKDGKPGNDFGHLHTELCFPHKATVSGEMTLNVTSIMHKNPGEFLKLVIEMWADNVDFKTPDCPEDNAVACKKFFHSPRSLEKCQATGGVLTDPVTCTWQDTLTFDTRVFPWDGWQQFRVRATVDEPDGKSMRTSTGLHAYLKNGKTVKHVYSDPDLLEARGWYSDVGYATSKVEGLTAGPVSGLWAPWVEMQPGAGGIPITSHYVALDAAVHAGNFGTPLLQGDGPYEGRVMIDTTTLTNGWHKLFLKAGAFDPITGSTNSGLFVGFFEVLNEIPQTCGLTDIEPAVADAYVRGGSYDDKNFGADDDLVVKSSSQGRYTRRSYLRFDLGGFGASTADSATFNAFVYFHEKPGTAVPLKLYSVSSDSWNEDTLTWNNQPGPAKLLGTVDVRDVGPVQFDITSQVKSELSGDKLLSLVLLEDSEKNKQLKIRSRTQEEDPPRLEIMPSASECSSPGTATPPIAPTGLTASAVSPEQIDLEWSDNAVDESGYQIERSPDNSSWTPIDTAPADTTSYTDALVASSSTYHYRVRAYNGAGASAWSGSASATTPAADPGGSTSTLTFDAIADASIYNKQPTNNYGSLTRLDVDASPIQEFLVKFKVSGVGSGKVTNAKLRLHTINSSAVGGDVYGVADNAWTEGGVTWNNAPSAGASKIGSIGAASVGDWVEVDISSLIKGDGTYSLRLKSTSTDGADYASKETSGDFAPQLVLTTEAGEDPGPAPGSTLTFVTTADASIFEYQPTTNQGSLTRLDVDSSPIQEFLVKFNVSG